MISEIISFQNNGVVSVVEFSTKRINTIDYISGAAAIRKNYIEVKEISQTGSVNNLIVHNNSDKYIFFSDGDILSGAKQNRVLNTSVFLAPNFTKQIPVSCVERGRWSHTSSKFSETDYTAPINLRAKKSEQVSENLDLNNGFMADQSEVWEEVIRCCEMNVVESPTSNLSDVFEMKKETIEETGRSLAASEKANGLAIFINRNLLSIELFNRQDIYKEYFSKILRGVNSEAMHLTQDIKRLEEVEATFKTNDFFDELENRKFKTFPGVGVGKEKRYESNDFSGFSLEFEEHLIHLAMLSLTK